jgi:hypothetical protein
MYNYESDNRSRKIDMLGLQEGQEGVPVYDCFINSILVTGFEGTTANTCHVPREVGGRLPFDAIKRSVEKNVPQELPVIPKIWVQMINDVDSTEQTFKG